MSLERKEVTKMQNEYKEIIQGMQQNPLHYEWYGLLGRYYAEQGQSNLAYLCYEQGIHFCNEREEKQSLEEELERAASQPDFGVNPVSIVILAQDDVSVLREALDSIQEQQSGTPYEIVVVCQPSFRYVYEQAEKCERARFICSDSKKESFGEGINTGIKNTKIHNDIYLMSSDAVLLPNTLFWLRMSLYERQTIGAAGGISNVGDKRQRFEPPCKTMEEYIAASEILNIPDDFAHENRLWLDSFSLLIKRSALDRVGLFETDQTCWYSCIDYGMKLAGAGREAVLCYNSFIWRRGKEHIQYDPDDFDRLKDRWGFSVPYYFASRLDIVEKIHHEQQEEIWVLEVGCGCGTTLSAIRCQYPNAHVYGIELMEHVAAYGTYMADIVVGDIETMEIPYEKNMFDYIIFADVLEHLRRPEQVLERMKHFLKQDGTILASIPNLMNIEIVINLLKGNFTYRDAGLLDRTHIHLFTLREIQKMLQDTGYVVKAVQKNDHREGFLEDSPENRRMIEALFQIEGIADWKEFDAYQYLVEAALCV